MRPESPELSDLIVDFEPETLARRPVRRSEVVRRLREVGNTHAARLAAALPARDDLLDEAEMDRLLVAAHLEIQRLSEEFEHGERVRSLLAEVLDVLRDQGAPRPLRVVDVGCGTGYVVRYLAAHAGWDDVELCGADFNPALVAHAEGLAAREGLRCRFRVANAFRLAEPGAVFLSTGVLHHFRGSALEGLFAQHERPEARAFLHFDFQPSPLAGPGAWLFHAARMRLPLARHDGVLSAVRAHPGERRLAAARSAAPGFRSSLYGQRVGPLPLPRAMQALVGLRPELESPFVARLGPRAARLGGFG